MSRAERWLTTIPSLADHELEVGFARAETYQGSLGEVAQALNEVCQRAELADGTARRVLIAFLPMIVDPAHLDRVGSLRATALASALPAASRLLRQATPEGHLLDRPVHAATENPLARQGERPLTLGERRALARQPSRAALAKLMPDPHPMVARIVLANPRVTEEDVILMAAHRPARPRILTEIACARAHHARARMAIILNPGAPPAVSVPLLGMLTGPELAQVMRAADLPNVVRSTARELRELRPPLDPIQPPSLPH